MLGLQVCATRPGSVFPFGWSSVPASLGYQILDSVSIMSYWDAVEGII